MADDAARARHGTMAEWRSKILAGDSDALDDALQTWREGALGIIQCAESGVPFSVHPLMQQVTGIVTVVCDTGPARISGEPFMAFHRIAKNISNGATVVRDSEMEKLFVNYERAMDASNRLVLVWVSREGGGIPNLDDDSPDGPWGVRYWRHNGLTSSDKMTQTQFELAKILHAKLGKIVHFDDVIGPEKLFDFDAEISTIQRHCSNISKWFEKQKPPIPITVKTDKTGMAMEILKAEE